jgi:hypothetical protein
MTSPAFEAFLVRLYVEEETRARFRADPAGEAARAGLGPEECEALLGIDETGLELAAHSVERKRNKTQRTRRERALWQRSLDWLTAPWRHGRD